MKPIEASDTSGSPTSTPTRRSHPLRSSRRTRSGRIPMPKKWLLTLWVLALLLSVLLVQACGRPTPSSSPMPLPESYLVADDFSHPNSAWARFDTEDSAVYALAGELYLEDRGTGTAVYTPLVDHTYAGVVVDVDVRHVQGSVNNWMGVLCRHQDADNYYLLAISADGYYLILKVVDGEAVPLTGPSYSDVIRTGKSENHLRVRCNGPALSLWVNEERLAYETDGALEGPGEVALLADAVQRGEIVVVAFDNFVLAEP